MRIIKIEIEKIRGIKKITLEPKGKSIVIFGPNGSGKSAVVDAIDFLLTGKISRLEGEGTDAISTKKHGPHVDHETKEAVVRAQVEVPGVDGIINLERKMSSPRNLKFDEAYKDYIQPSLEVSEIGQHKLSRREILHYIMATAGTRAEEIHALLNLESIDKIRKSLVSVSNSLDREKSQDSDTFERTKTEIKSLLGLEEFSEEDCLKKINENKKLLNAIEISDINQSELTKDVSQPIGKGEGDIKNLQFLKQDILSLKNQLKTENLIVVEDDNLKAKLKEFNENIEYRKELAHRTLLEIGLKLIDGRNACPLCEKYWDAQELREFLNKRFTESNKADTKRTEIKTASEKFRTSLVKYKILVENIETYYKNLGLEKLKENIKSMKEKMVDLNEKLLDPTEKYSEDNSVIKEIFTNKGLERLNKELDEEISGLKYEISPQLASWTILSKLEVLLKQYQEAKGKFKKAELLATQSSLLLSNFEKARDSVLQDIYTNINSDFSKFYKELHGDDEKDFESSFIPKEAELLFEVDFYKRGKFHPGAMHSEGHQDSMGFCLFLSLNKFLAKNNLSLMVLDDVVMSVDAQHRRNICKTLLSNFPEKQFIITTHDRIWAKQLKTETVVNSKNMYEFKWWSIETGPTTGQEENFWESIEDDLNKNKVPQAAWKLRRSAECFFSEACDLLRARVVFKSDGYWELGDYLYAAKEQFISLLKRAKESANSWDNRQKIDELNAFDTELTKVIEKSQIEQWIINPNVHYNNWDQYQPSDFKPVVEAYRNLFRIFTCGNCNYIPMLLLSKDRNPELLKCDCGNIDWNLHIKEKSESKTTGT